MIVLFDRYEFTCSMLWLTTYRITVVLFSWPIRIERPIAWSSMAGFHWGSRMWIRVAAVRFRLVGMLVNIAFLFVAQQPTLKLLCPWS